MNRDADVENEHVDTGGKVKGGMNWENGIDMCEIGSWWEPVI